MNGILNILKPPGMTSFDVIGYMRGILKIKKIGHAGTLDPDAAGVLPVFIGNATGAIEYMTGKSKIYRAEMTLGVTTDTQDASGKITGLFKADVTDRQIADCIKSFEGKYMQTPPMYSAVKINGKKLYELARNGIVVERKSREIEIYSAGIVDINRENGLKVLFDVHCSKGTYIRTLCADIGERLGCGGHMSFLVRTCAGGLDIDSSSTLEEIAGLAACGRLGEKLLNVDSVLSEFDQVVLDEADMKRILNGICIGFCGEKVENGEIVRVYDKNGAFVLLAKVTGSGEKLQLKSAKQFN